MSQLEENFEIYLICLLVGILNQFVLLRYLLRSFTSGDWKEWNLVTIVPLCTAAADVVLVQLGFGPIVLAATAIAMILDALLFRNSGNSADK
jgi:hypothetical protein